jgi:predicted nucleotidyltransferase
VPDDDRSAGGLACAYEGAVTPDSARISELIARVLAAVLGIVSAYLFGSVVSGRAHRVSDVDVAVLLAWTAYPGREERFDARLRLIGIVGAALGRARQVKLETLRR